MEAKDKSPETNLDKLMDWVAKENDKPRPEPTYTISPEGMKQFEDALKELYPYVEYTKHPIKKNLS